MIKKTRSNMAKLMPEKQFVERHVLIDFRAARIYISPKGLKTSHLRGEAWSYRQPKTEYKHIEFSEIVSTEKADPDIWTGEVEIEKLKGKGKFIVFTSDRTFTFFTANYEERDIWIQNFCRIIDVNAGNDAGHGVVSNTYRSLTKLSTRSVSRYKPTNKPTYMQKKAKGIDEYESQTLQMSDNVCKGYLMKRIEQRKIYHRSNFHKRYFEFQFSRSIILVKQLAGDANDYKRIPIESIRACSVQNQEEQVASEGGGSFKRSNSWLSKLRKDDEETCPWNFNFQLETSDRSMELFAPTRQDRDKWMMIFNLIIEMNEKLISTKLITPLSYKKQQEEEAKQTNKEEQVPKDQQ